MSAPGVVEDYLDQLYARLRCPPRAARRILAEAEDHLRESVDGGLAAGLTQAEAEEQAISSFGSVRAVVRAHRPRRRGPRCTWSAPAGTSAAPSSRWSWPPPMRSS